MLVLSRFLARWQLNKLSSPRIPLHTHKQGECSVMGGEDVSLAVKELKFKLWRGISAWYHWCISTVKDRLVSLSPNYIHARLDIAIPNMTEEILTTVFIQCKDWNECKNKVSKNKISDNRTFHKIWTDSGICFMMKWEIKLNQYWYYIII